MVPFKDHRPTAGDLTMAKGPLTQIGALGTPTLSRFLSRSREPLAWAFSWESLKNPR